MRECDGFDSAGSEWESRTTAAWRRFQMRLADRFAELADDEVVLLEAETSAEADGAGPYAQVWSRQGRLRCEAVSNHYLAASHRLDDAAEAALQRLGFAPPTSATDRQGSLNFWVDADGDVGEGGADRLAALVVPALRDVYGVPHPAFLTGDALVDAREEESGYETAGPDEADGVAGEPAVYPVHGREHLQRLVDEALTPFFGHPPDHDADGDIPVAADDVTAYVSVLPDRPVVRVFACLAARVRDAGRADFEVGVLNRDVPLLKFFRRGEGVFLQVDVVGWPFVADHLRQLVQRVCQEVGQIRDDLVVRLASAEEAPHPAMLTLLHLDAQEPGSVDARLAASICEHDRDLVLRLLEWNADQENAWRDARDDAEAEGDRGLAGICEDELDQVARTTALLQAALRVVVQRQAARFPVPRSGGRSESRRRSESGWQGRGPQRVPDPTLEEVDPGMWG